MDWGRFLHRPLKERRIELKKDEFFQLRLSKDDRAKLDALARHYNVSASAVICMLIAEDFRILEKEYRDEGLILI